MEPKHSKRDSRGMLYVACSECERGGNGDQSCSSGWQIKKGGKNACFSGNLLGKYELKEK